MIVAAVRPWRVKSEQLVFRAGRSSDQLSIPPSDRKTNLPPAPSDTHCVDFGLIPPRWLRETGKIPAL